MFSIMEAAERLGVSVPYIYKLCRLIDLKPRGPRGQKRYFTPEEVELLDVLVILSGCGIEVQNIRKYYHLYFKNGVWNINKLVNDKDVPYLPQRAVNTVSKAERILKVVKSWYGETK